MSGQKSGLFAAIIMFLGAVSGPTWAVTCSEPMYPLEMGKEYHRHFCAALSAEEEMKFAVAADEYETALSIQLWEMPNFELFDELAVARAKSGQMEQAKLALRKAELSRLFYFKTYICKETDQGYVVIASKTGKVTEDLEIVEMSRRMCGAFYQTLYERTSMEHWQSDVKYITSYFDAKRIVEGLEQAAK